MIHMINSDFSSEAPLKTCTRWILRHQGNFQVMKGEDG